MKVLKAEYMEVQDAQVKDVTDRVSALESRLAEAAVSFNEELHPSFLTVVAGRRWLLSHGLRLFLTKCLGST